MNQLTKNITNVRALAFIGLPGLSNLRAQLQRIHTVSFKMVPKPLNSEHHFYQL